MTGSWIGSAKAAAKALVDFKADQVEGQFRVHGPAIEYVLRNDVGDKDWDFVEIKPATLCYQGGLPVPIVFVLKSLDSKIKVTAGLPIAPRRN